MKSSISLNRKSISLILIVLAIGFIAVFGGRKWPPLMTASASAQDAPQAGAAPPAGSWAPQTSGVTNFLNDVHFIGNEGWVSGGLAALIKTTNAGVNWGPPAASPGVSTSNGFNSVRMIDQNVVWAGGLYSVTRTANAGASWETRERPTDNFRNSFFPTSANIIWAAGGGGGCRSFFRYTFTGNLVNEETWSFCLGSLLSDILFIDADNGWSVGAFGQIYRITGGSAPTPTFTPQTSGTTNSLNAIFMLDANTGWIVGASGTILKTINGGATWSPQNSGVTTALNDVYFVDANLGWVVGDGGVILVTTDGGANWISDPSGVTVNLAGVFFTSASVGYAVGASGTILKRTTCTPPTIDVQPISRAICLGNSVTFTVSASGPGPLSYLWQKNGVDLPGATNPSYNIPSVTPGDAGSYTVKVTNSCTTVISNAVTLTVNTPPAITAQPQPLTLCAGTSATFQVTATGTGLSYQWRKNGVPISGATNPTFTIPSTTATDSGNYDVVVAGVCNPSPIISIQASLTVNPVTSITAQPQPLSRVIGQSATFSVTAAGANLTYQWRKNGTNIPGATNPSYTIPSVGFSDQGNYSVVVTGACGTVTSVDAALTVGCQPITVNPPILPNAQIGQPYDQTISHIGGVGTVTCALSMGALPNGLNLAPNCVISGTPTVSGQFPIKVKATDSNGCFGERDYTGFEVGICLTITITPASLPPGNVGTPYSQTLTATGGTPPRTFMIMSGGLPTGLSLSSGGVISGTPTAAGSFSFTVKVTDNAGCTGTQQYTVVICSTIAISPPALPNGFINAPYSQTLTQTGGVAPITWSVMSGALPTGLSLSSGGVISGTPTQVGVFDFIVKATDVNNCMGTRNYRIVISGNGLQYYPLSKPIRLLDTRPSQPACSTPGTPLTGGAALTLPARGNCQGETIPADAKAIVGNATVVNLGAGSGGGFITLYPSDAALPTVSNLNFLANQIIPNAFTVGLGNVDGAFKIYPSPGTSPDFIVDVTGYFAPPSSAGLFYHPLPHPIRLLDTRSGATGCTTPGVPLTGGQSLTQPAELTCDGITIPASAQAIIGNGTVVNFQSAGGFITLYPDGAQQPTVSNLNYSANQIIPNAFTVSLGPSGAFKIFASAVTDFIVDVTGYYSNDPGPDVNGVRGLLFNPLSKPIRLFDTRTGATACDAPGAPLIGGGTRTQLARRTCDGETIPAEAQAVIGNATVVNFISAGGFITLWPEGAVQPTVSNLNYQANQIIPNAFTVGLGSNGEFNIFASAATHFITDLTGYFSP